MEKENIYLFIQWVSDVGADWFAAIIASFALYISIKSAGSARRSAEEAAKQNVIAIHHRKVDLYKELMRIFNQGLDMPLDTHNRENNKVEFSNTCQLIKFLFKPNVYKEVENLLENYKKFSDLQIQINDLGIQQNHLMLNAQPELKQIGEKRFGVLKEAGSLRDPLRDKLEKCKALIEAELTLH